MSTIYESKGRAREYSELAMNLYRGCSHGCTYCSSPLVLHKDRAEFHKSGHLFAQTTAEISDAARRLQQNGEKRPILLCFTVDPYSPEEAATQRTRQVIEILHAHGLKVIILTKGGMRAARDFDLLGPGDQFATTLTCLAEKDSLMWEPGAALPIDRQNSLVAAHRRGIETWVSLEPVISPSDTLQIIRSSSGFVAHWKVGTMNYHPHAKTIDWKAFGWSAKQLMDSMGVKYYFKRDLLEKMGVIPEEFVQTWRE